IRRRLMNRCLARLTIGLALLAVGACAARAAEDDLENSDTVEVGHAIDNSHVAGEHAHVGAAGVSDDPSELKSDLAIY
ncbi:MAG TPA: hypothetical protein VGJ26_01500, partial [Pirellulales bacterium]